MSAGNVATVAPLTAIKIANVLESLVPVESQFWTADNVTFAKQIFDELRVLHATGALTERTITLIQNFEVTANKCTIFTPAIKEEEANLAKISKEISKFVQKANTTSNRLQTLNQEEDKITHASTLEKIKSDLMTYEKIVKTHEEQIGKIAAVLTKIEQGAEESISLVLDLYEGDDLQSLQDNIVKGTRLKCYLEEHKKLIEANVADLKSQIEGLRNQLKQIEASSSLDKEKHAKLKVIQSQQQDLRGEYLQFKRWVESFEGQKTSHKEKLAKFSLKVATLALQNLSNLVSMRLELDKQKAATAQTAAAPKK